MDVVSKPAAVYRANTRGGLDRVEPDQTSCSSAELLARSLETTSTTTAGWTVRTMWSYIRNWIASRCRGCRTPSREGSSRPIAGFQRG